MKRIVALLVLLVLFLSMAPAVHAYEAPVTSSNIDEHYYVNAGRFNDPITSTLEVTEEGYTRVEYVGDRLIAEKYDRNFQFISGQEIQLELPIYGGVYLGEDYNFVVVGQTNPDEDDAVEVFRIVRYSKDWVRQASVSLYGANTYIPFDAGSLRFARSGDILYIRTAHEMYADESGIHHQANVMISVRISDMTVTDQLTKVWNRNYGYVSHSFNQFVLVDGNTLLAVDHGDALPRSVVLFKYSAPAGQETFYSRTSYVNALPIVDSTYHYNDTGVSVGGFEASSDHYLIAGSSADQTEPCDLMYAHRNIFVTATPKDNFTDEATAIHWLTSYQEEDNVEVSPPHLVKLSDDRFFLIWTENGQLRYCTLNGKGELEGSICSGEGDLSDCVPVVDGTKVIWYVTDSTEPEFYVIDPDASAPEHSYTAVVTEPTCTEQGYTTYTCLNCGDSYVSDYTDPVDHVYEGGKCKWCGETEGLPGGTWGDNITWEITFDGILIVTGDGEVAEKSTGNPYPWAAYASQIKKVIFEEGVTNVPYGAFNGSYTNLTSVELKSVEVIGGTAFAQCYALTEVILPNTLKEIGTGAFTYTGITTIEIPVGVTTIGSGAFSDTPLTEIVLPEGLTSIGSDAFMFCGSLKTVVLPDSLTSWDRMLFANCGALESVNIPAGVSSIPSTLFNNCYSLKSLEIPGNITSIEYGAFSSTGLEEITFLGDAPEIGELCFEDLTVTAYYPADNETWTEEVMQQYGGTITWVPYGEEEYVVEWKSGTTSLNGTIDLNIYVVLSDNLINDPNAFVRFSYAGKNVDIPMSEAEISVSGGVTRYRFSCEMYAKQVSEQVTIQVMKGDEVIGDALQYSVMQYCMNRINKSTNPDQVALCKALLNYAAAVQTYFGYNTENLANADLAEADKILPDVALTGYKAEITGSEPGIRAKSATLMLEAEVFVRVYFVLEEGYDISDFTFTIDGVEVTPAYNEKGWYVESPGIPAKELDSMPEFKVGGITVRYGALSYVQSKLSSSDVNVVNMAKALYAYFVAAEKLLG